MDENRSSSPRGKQKQDVPRFEHNADTLLEMTYLVVTTEIGRARTGPLNDMSLAVQRHNKSKRLIDAARVSPRTSVSRRESLKIESQGQQVHAIVMRVRMMFNDLLNERERLGGLCNALLQCLTDVPATAKEISAYGSELRFVAETHAGNLIEEMDDRRGQAGPAIPLAIAHLTCAIECWHTMIAAVKALKGAAVATESIRLMTRAMHEMDAFGEICRSCESRLTPLVHEINKLAADANVMHAVARDDLRKHS